METDFTLITKDTFILRENTFVLNSPLKTKYDNIIKDHECFHAKPAPTHYVHKARFVKKPQHNSHHEGRTMKDPVKSMQCLFNILNDSNYSKIFHKMKFLVSNDNLISVINKILKCGVTHKTYRKHFLRLILDLFHIWDREAISTTIKEFFNDFIMNNKRLCMEKTDTTTDYDVFCLEQKHKQKMLNTNMLLLDAYDMFAGKINVDVEGCVARVMQELQEVIMEDRLIDIFLQMLVQYAEHKTINMTEHKDTIVALPKHHLSVKNRFLFENVICAFGLRVV
jgi:hypothetical protein